MTIKINGLHMMWIAAAVACGSACRAAVAAARDAYDANARIGKGINLGNVLEARREYARYVKVEDEDFRLMAEAGFNSVRIPARWSAYALEEAPYTIEPAFFARVDRAVKQALSHGLVVILNIHHYHEFVESPADHKERLLGMWKQIAGHYRDYPKQLYFEILNEPHGNVTAELWNGIQNETIELIRKSNPNRTILTAPVDWNRIRQLRNLELPSDDRNLIVTVHYYEPHGFTHQGAGWVKEPRPVGIPWEGSEEERRVIADEFETAAAWSAANRVPINVGEFGAYSKADIDSRVRWTTHVREQAEKHGMSWNYWEFRSSFGVYDPEEKVWRKELLQSLLPE